MTAAEERDLGIRAGMDCRDSATTAPSRVYSAFTTRPKSAARGSVTMVMKSEAPRAQS